MIKTGLIVKIEDKYAIVMTKDNSYQRIFKKSNMNIGSEIMYTDADVMQNYRKKRVKPMNKKLLLPLPILALVLTLILFNTGKIFSIDNTELASKTIITLDVNPSFKLYTDAENNVLKIESINDDAKTIKSDDLVKMTTVDAIDLLVERCEVAGFIDTEDLEEDFVLITTIDADETDSIDNTEMLMTQLQTRSQISDSLGKVNVAMTQATMEQLKSAEQQNISVGLVKMNNGNSTTVKEFFANDENVKLFEENGYMIQNSFTHQLQIMQTMIDDSDFDGELQNNFSQEFQYSKEAYIEANNQYQQAMQNYRNADASESQTLLQEAEQLRLQLETNKQNVIRLGSILNKAVNNEESQEIIMQELTNEKQMREENQINKPIDTGNTQENSQSQSEKNNTQNSQNENQEQQDNSNSNSSNSNKN